MKEFARIYSENEWGYGSGVGSLPINNVEYMRFLQSFIRSNNVRSILDYGCGDWQFSRFVDWNGATYIGVDVVAAVVQRNRELFGRENISFEILGSGKALPKDVDLIICKDVFQHLPNGVVAECVQELKSCARFVLITNDEWPDEDRVNADIEEGGWRPVRLDRQPFGEVAPVILSWTIEWGGWKPTRKATCLVAGSGKGT